MPTTNIMKDSFEEMFLPEARRATSVDDVSWQNLLASYKNAKKYKKNLKKTNHVYDI